MALPYLHWVWVDGEVVTAALIDEWGFGRWAADIPDLQPEPSRRLAGR
jgi:hypothetical protein